MDIKEILKKTQKECLRRDFQGLAEKIDEDNRTVELSFSSELPTDRWYGMEILDHQITSVRLKRLNEGAPVCWLHPTSDFADQRGVVEKAWLDNSRGRAIVRFGKSADANELFQDVKDGIKRNISMVYYVHNIVMEREGKNGDPSVYRVIDWEPLSIDFVPLPADYTVGVGRSKEMQDNKTKETKTMEKCQICGKELISGVCPDNCAARARIDVKDVQERERKAERDRVSAIMTISEQHECRELGKQAIADGVSKEDFAGMILEKKYNAKKLPLDTSADKVEGIDEKDARQFSVARAIQQILEGTWKKGSREKEMSDHVARLVGRDPQSFFIPYSVMISKSDIFDTSVSAGAGAIATHLLMDSFIEALRNKAMILQMGATVLPGLVGDIAIPKQTATVTAQWIAEGNAATKSKAKIEQLTMSPKTISGSSDLSRKLLKQTSMAIESFVQQELVSAVHLAIDLAGINGVRDDVNPGGILKTAGIGAVVSGGDVNWGHCVDLWTAVADANVDIRRAGYLTNAFVIGGLAKTPKATNTAAFIADALPGENMLTTIGGIRCGMSGQVPKTLGTTANKTALIFGNWSDLIFGLWGGLDVLVDPYSQSDKGNVRIVVHQDIDTLIRHPESFAAIQDIDTA